MPNHWLASFQNAIRSLFQDLGSPESWPQILIWGSIGLWTLLFLCLIFSIEIGKSKPSAPAKPFSTLPAHSWVLGAAWIWHTKPELWFIFYFHVAIWCLVGITLLQIWNTPTLPFRKTKESALTSVALLVTFVFGYVDIDQTVRLGRSKTWNWPTYYDFVDCIDQRLIQLEKDLGAGKPFHVWDPTFPDVTVELSLRHPHWEFTRTNDFMNRSHLAIQHGWDVEAVVVTETLNFAEATFSEKAENIPLIQSVWMRWEGYFLNDLWKSSGWKPERFICQRGRWQAFLFMKRPN